MKQIIARIKGNKVEFEVNGVTGASCTDITKQLEEAVGKTESQELKSEFYETEEQTNSVDQG